MELFEALEQDNTEGGVEVTRRAQLDGLPPIKVVGVGGGGCNAVNRMVQASIAGVEFVGVNTDAQALMRCDAETRIRIGDRISRGLGGGGDPDRGGPAAEESHERPKAAPALMAIGRAEGENRAVEAAQAAIASPLLDVNIHGARGVLFNVSSSGTMGLHELNMAAQVIAEVVDPEAEIIFGTSTDAELGEEVKITLIATGFDGRERYASQAEDEEFRRIREEAAQNQDDMDLPTFLRRPVSVR